MSRPTRFEHYQFLGDKRTQVVYDLDDATIDRGVIDEVVAAGKGAAFGPDTVAEARNRGYRPYSARDRARHARARVRAEVAAATLATSAGH